MLPYLRHNPSVLTVRHALALNEHRSWFNATTWGQLDSDAEGAKKRLKNKDLANYGLQDIYEVWFRGCHSDIGGGDIETHTARITLHRMLCEAHQAEVRLNKEGMQALTAVDSTEPVHIHDLYKDWQWADYIPRCEIDNSGLYPRRKFAWGPTGSRIPQQFTRNGKISLHP